MEDTVLSLGKPHGAQPDCTAAETEGRQIQVPEAGGTRLSGDSERHSCGRMVRGFPEGSDQIGLGKSIWQGELVSRYAEPGVCIQEIVLLEVEVSGWQSSRTCKARDTTQWPSGRSQDQLWPLPGSHIACHHHAHLLCYLHL